MKQRRGVSGVVSTFGDLIQCYFFSQPENIHQAWWMSSEDRRTVIDFCRRGIWINLLAGHRLRRGGLWARRTWRPRYTESGISRCSSWFTGTSKTSMVLKGVMKSWREVCWVTGEVEHAECPWCQEWFYSLISAELVEKSCVSCYWAGSRPSSDGRCVSESMCVTFSSGYV